MVNGPWLEMKGKVHGQWSIVHGRNEGKSPWSMVNSPWKGVKKKKTMVNGP